MTSSDDAPDAVAPPLSPRPRRSRWGIAQAVVLSALVTLLVCCTLSTIIAYTGAAARGDCGAPNPGGTVLAGAATADISPTAPVYLGGYGIGPVRRSTGVLLPLRVRALALGAHNTLAAPDWPGVTAGDVEAHLGGVAVVLVGALGHTWPKLPASTTDDLARVTSYGLAISAAALGAAAGAQPLGDAQICVSDRRFREADTAAPLLLALQTFGSQGGTHILRATASPYFIPPNVLSVEVTVARIGDVLFFAAPVEPYPSLLSDLRTTFPHRTLFLFGLANDQLGYAPRLSEYAGAVASSPTDEGLFILDPGFGEDLLHALGDGGHAVLATP